MKLNVSVLIPAHNPNPARFARTLEALCAQTLPADEWETIVIDNASTEPIDLARGGRAPRQVRAVREPNLGLTHARRRGFLEATAPLCVLVDDDNALAPDYLAQVTRIFAAHPRIGAIGGKSLPEFEVAPPAWASEFLPLLALRDLGDEPRIASGKTDAAGRTEYPAGAAPIGAGMAIRRDAIKDWLADPGAGRLSDRRGAELASAGDNELVFSILAAGWEVGYFPELALTHLIPAVRLDPAYLGRLNRGIQKSWMQVLSKHRANPWPAISGASVPLRKLKAWFVHQAWSGPAARIRWEGACGHFEGRAAG